MTLLFAYSVVIYLINTAQSLKQVTLTPDSTTKDGASVTVTGASGEVTSANSQWTICGDTCECCDTWHFVVDLDDSWGFDANYESNITFEIDGDAIDNLIVAFTTRTLNKYIAIRIRESYVHKIVPNTDVAGTYCPLSGSAPLVDGNISAALNQASDLECPDSRYCRIGVYTHNTCDNVNEIQGSGNRVFPIIFTLTNKPNSVDNILRFNLESTSSGTENYIERCQYEAFETNQGLRIFIAKDEAAICTIRSLKITYSTASDADISTTVAQIEYPSNHPTKYPTKYPSSHPLFNPTETPLYNPTQAPFEVISERTQVPFIQMVTTQSVTSSSTLTDGNESLITVTEHRVYEQTNTVKIQTDMKTNTNTMLLVITILLSVVACVMFPFCCVYIMRTLLSKRREIKSSSYLSEVQSVSHENNNNLRAMQMNVVDVNKSMDPVAMNNNNAEEEVEEMEGMKVTAEGIQDNTMDLMLHNENDMEMNTRGEGSKLQDANRVPERTTSDNGDNIEADEFIIEADEEINQTAK